MVLLAGSLIVCASLVIWFVRVGRDDTDPLYGLSIVDTSHRPLGPERGGLQLQLAPFTVYANVSNHEATEGDVAYRINADGMRGPDAPPRSAKRRILLVGGSAAFGYQVADAQTLARTLEGLLGVEVLNAAVIGYLSGQELSLVAHRALDFDPDLVLVFDGWNDAYDGYFDQLAVRQNPFLLIKRLYQLPKPIAFDVDRAPAPYDRNLRAMRTALNGAGQPLLVVLPPSLDQMLDDVATRRASPDFFPHDAYWTEMPALYQHFREQAAAREPLLAGTTLLHVRNQQAEALFLDPVHLSPPRTRADGAGARSENPRGTSLAARPRRSSRSGLDLVASQGLDPGNWIATERSDRTNGDPLHLSCVRDLGWPPHRVGFVHRCDRGLGSGAVPRPLRAAGRHDRIRALLRTGCQIREARGMNGSAEQENCGNTYRRPHSRYSSRV